MKISLLCLGLLGSVIAGACGGGSDGGGGCGAAATCGGDIVGAWTITASCLQGTLDLGSVCPGLTSDLNLTLTGAATYNADLTYVQTGTGQGTMKTHYPGACLGGMTCAQVQAAVLSQGAQGGTVTSASCSSTSGGGCVCDTVLMDIPDGETGTYSTASGVLSTTHDGVTDQSGYCVTARMMHQSLHDPLSGTVTGTVTLSKQ